MKGIKVGMLRVVLFILLIGQLESVYSQSEGNQSGKNKVYNLTGLEWKLWGYRPESWKLDFNFAELRGTKAEYLEIPVSVPGSVQKALKDAGIISDWNVGNNNISSEWVENRHWLYVAKIPDA